MALILVCISKDQKIDSKVALLKFPPIHLRYLHFCKYVIDFFLTFRYLKQHQHYYKSKKTVIFVLTGHRYQNKYIH